jgi:transposase
VAENFLGCDRDQELLLPPGLREWLPQDHLAWFVLDAVDEIDLSAFYGAYREDGWGRAAFEPAMMVARLLYAYAVGERSSRAIKRRCREDVAFRVITANGIPDQATIARFRARHEQALAATFTLALCARAGLVSVGVVALDGGLLAGNASPRATRSYAAIRVEVEQILSEAAEADADEDERLGEARGDELPAELADARSRRERLRRCKQQLEHEQADEELAYRANLAWRAAWEAEHAPTGGSQTESARSSRARRAEDQHHRPRHAAGEIRRSDRFLRRGLAACQAEWQLIAATHNLLKLWRSGLADAPKTTAKPLAA